jgi:hypothetical protein
MQTTKWFHTFLKLNATAVSVTTWNKYLSAVKKLTQYCSKFSQILQWPLTDTLLCGFVLWCLETEKLKSETVKAYLYGLSHIQKIHGFAPIPVAASPTLPYILSGAKNRNTAKETVKRRHPITYQHLQKIRQYIVNSHWCKYNKIVMWTCSLVAFFGSFRLGELLSKKTRTFDKTSTLLKKHIIQATTTTSWEVWIQSPKSKLPQGETVTLFPFPNQKYCPVFFLNKLDRQQRKHDLNKDDLPFFRFQSGRNITVKKMNKFLTRIFTPEGKEYIRGHSFRSGLVSSAANYPDLINDAHIKGWGRWRSNAFLRYEHFDVEQKKYIFNKLIATLQPSH